jgi:2-methylcitrate dehydratase PrpD
MYCCILKIENYINLVKYLLQVEGDESMPEKKRSASEILSEGVLKVRFEDLAERNVVITKDKILDAVGNMAGGAPIFGNRELLNAVKQYGNNNEAPIFFFGERASLGDAAMMNAVTGRSNDFDAMYMNIDGKRMPSKTSGTIVPTALTIGDTYGLSGKELITTSVVGDDLSVRIIAAGGLWAFNLGWDSSFTMPIFGVIAQLARIRGLTAEQLRDAWGMGYNMVGGSMSNIFDYATSAKLGQGYSARNADFAVRLAREGWSSIRNAFEGPRNLYRQYRGMDEACNPDLLTGEYGKKFYMEETIKLYPVGSPAIPIAFAGQALHSRVETKEIALVELCIPSDYTGMYYTPEFELGRDPVMHAQYSYQFAVCAALLHGSFTIRNYDLKVIKDPVLLDLISRTKILRDEALTNNNLRIRVTTKDGRVLEHMQTPEEFSMHTYPTREQLLSKYWDQICTYNLVSRAKAQEIIDLIDHLEDLTDVRELTSLMMPEWDVSR